MTTPGGLDFRGTAASSDDLYKEKVATYVNQRTNQKLSKETLARDFTKKTGNAFKMACARLELDQGDSKLKMPMMRQYGMMEASVADGREEAKRGPRIQVPPSHVIDIVKEDEKKVRDLYNLQTNQELIQKVMGTEAIPTYDNRYLNELVNSF